MIELMRHAKKLTCFLNFKKEILEDTKNKIEPGRMSPKAKGFEGNPNHFCYSKCEIQFNTSESTVYIYTMDEYHLNLK